MDGRVLLAADYRVPQSRERVFFIGFRKNTLKKSALKALE
jgi:DNA (cytosine-5)-methyltransferase 1